MSAILEIVEKLQDTQAAITQLESFALKNPRSEIVKVNLNSLYSRQDDLQKSFSELAADDLVDVCSYRLIAGDDARYAISILSKILGDFQDLLTIVYDAIKNNTQKQRADITLDIAQQSSLEFGYTFSGSLGFVFMMPNERLIAVDSDLDLAMKTIFNMAKAADSSEVSSFAKRVGVAPIRAIYRWAKVHVESGLSADIQWKRKEEVRANLLIQPPELDRLLSVISETSEEISEPISIYGQLVGGDTDKRTFHLKIEGDQDIIGHLNEAFKPPENFALDKYYRANIIKKSFIHYSIDKKDEVYLLVSLENYL